MPTNAYVAKLRNPLWQKRRLEILEAANWACEDCGTKDQELQVHHCAYIPDAEPWEHTRSELMACCDSCHKRRQRLENAARVAVGRYCRKQSPGALESASWELIEKVIKGNGQQ